MLFGCYGRVSSQVFRCMVAFAGCGSNSFRNGVATLVYCMQAYRSGACGGYRTLAVSSFAILLREQRIAVVSSWPLAHGSVPLLARCMHVVFPGLRWLSVLPILCCKVLQLFLSRTLLGLLKAELLLRASHPRTLGFRYSATLHAENKPSGNEQGSAAHRTAQSTDGRDGLSTGTSVHSTCWHTSRQSVLHGEGFPLRKCNDPCTSRGLNT